MTSRKPVDVEWERIAVRATRKSSHETNYTERDVYKAWYPGHPLVVAIGTTLDEAIARLLDKTPWMTP